MSNKNLQHFFCGESNKLFTEIPVLAESTGNVRPCFWGKNRNTVFDLITALCAKVFQNNWEHSVVVKYVSNY